MIFPAHRLPSCYLTLTDLEATAVESSTMADSLQQSEVEDDCITPRQSTTITLRYPSIPVTGTPDSWLSNSLLVPMASHQDEGSVRSNDDTTSSLDGSAYDFIDDTSYGTTDDEDQSRMTESVSVVDDSTHEPAGNPDLERTLSRDCVQHPPSDNFTRNDVRSFGDGSASQKDPIRCDFPPQSPRRRESDIQKSSSLMNVRFEETHHGEGIHRLESPSIPENLAVTVRQQMLDSIPSPKSPCQLLYVGNVVAKEEIRAKISAALAAIKKTEARTGGARMPVSDRPEHEVDVYHCVNASFGRMDNGHDTIELILDDRTTMKSAWDGCKFSVAAQYKCPDLVIFYLSEHDSVSARQTRRFARSFMARHKIPSIVINEKSTWDRPSEAMMIDHLTPHICLQAANRTESLSRIVKRLPIDLSIFSRLDDLQLGQNLAFLALQGRISQTKHQIPTSAKYRASLTGDDRSKLDAPVFTTRKLREYLGITSFGLPWLLNLLAVACVCVAASILIRQQIIPSARPITNVPNVHTASSSASSLAFPAVVTSIPLLKGKPTAVQSLTVQDPAKATALQRASVGKSNTDLAALLLESSHPTVNKSEHFKVQILGQAHLILRPPHWFTRLRRTPKLNLKITQGNRVLAHQTSTLFDGVYALELPYDEAHGAVNITVWTESKPKIHESLQADFGNSWLHTASWKKTASALSTSLRQDLHVVQTSLVAGYIHSGAEMRSLMRKTLAKAKDLSAETRTISKAYITRLATTTDLVLAFERKFSSESARVFQQKKAAAAKEVSLRTKHFRRDVSAYLSDRVHVARVYAQAAPTAYRIHLRNTQKKALKLWWSMTGLPGQRSDSVKANGRSRACNVKSKKRAGVR